MTEQHYRVRQSKGRPDLISGTVLQRAKFCEIEVPEPHWNAPEGEWYCMNTNCVVRECTVRSKTYGEELPTMLCPACRSAMKFDHWIDHEMLEPVDPAGEPAT